MSNIMVLPTVHKMLDWKQMPSGSWQCHTIFGITTINNNTCTIGNKEISSTNIDTVKALIEFEHNLVIGRVSCSLSL
jgi:hypothetical protein